MYNQKIGNQSTTVGEAAATLLPGEYLWLCTVVKNQLETFTVLVYTARLFLIPVSSDSCCLSGQDSQGESREDLLQ